MKHRISLLDMTEAEIRYLYNLCRQDAASRTGDLIDLLDASMDVTRALTDLTKDPEAAGAFQDKMVAAIKSCSCENPNCKLHHPDATQSQQSF